MKKTVQTKDVTHLGERTQGTIQGVLDADDAMLDKVISYISSGDGANWVPVSEFTDWASVTCVQTGWKK